MKEIPPVKATTECRPKATTYTKTAKSSYRNMTANTTKQQSFGTTAWTTTKNTKLITYTITGI